MATYGPELNLGEARVLFFARGGFPADGGYGDAWVKLRMWRIPIWFPNTKGRRYAVKFHDLHHILTEYPTTWRGETEISAWEIATGLRRHYAGWLLDLLGIAMGLVINPRGVYRAFVRGRHSRNLYGLTWDEKILAQKVGEMRRELHLDSVDARATMGDKLSFAFWALAGALTYLATGVVLLLPSLLILLAILRLSGWL
jgi:hypothetical protein